MVPISRLATLCSPLRRRVALCHTSVLPSASPPGRTPSSVVRAVFIMHHKKNLHKGGFFYGAG